MQVEFKVKADKKTTIEVFMSSYRKLGRCNGLP